MARKGLKRLSTKQAVEFLSLVVEDKPLLPFLIPLVLLAWVVERWIVPFSNWVPLIIAVWAAIEYGRYQRKLLVEDLNHKWKQFMLNASPCTPIEPCEWLNKLLLDVWPNYMEPKISRKLFSVVERRLKHRKPRLIERLELLEFSLGSCPPSLGLRGTHWYTSGDQRVLQMGFDWVTNDMSIMLSVKLTKPISGTARIVVNSLHIKGNLLLMPILDGQAVLYSFECAPEVRLGVAFGSGGSQTLPATELPGVSTWLEKLVSETMTKTMVEPRRGCYSLPAIDLRKKSVGGLLSVGIVSASNIAGTCEGQRNSNRHDQFAETFGNTNLQTFIEVEIGELTRKTSVRQGSDPKWDETFNMTLHGDTGIIKFNIYRLGVSSVKFDFLTCCEIKMRYVADDSTMFWAIGSGSSIVAKRCERCGLNIDMIVPFEGNGAGELTVRLVLKEWLFSEDSNNLMSSIRVRSHQSSNGPLIRPRTGRKIKMTILEGRNLLVKSAKCDPYVKLQYGKASYRTKTISHDSYPVWNQKFEFDELGDGEYVKLKCYTADVFSDEIIGSARLNLDGISEGGSPKDVWIPLEKVDTGELRIQLEAVKNNDVESSFKRSGSGWIELLLIEAKDLVAADLRGTSDPYVRVHYGNMKRRTKVVHKTLNPKWNQTLDFPDTGSPLALHVKDHNAVLPTTNIGSCKVEYEGLLPNQTIDKWIPLQGVKCGEIHIQITRRNPELEKISSLDSDSSGFSKAICLTGKMRETLKRLQDGVEDGEPESMEQFLSDIECAQDLQEEYMLRLEKEKNLLLTKINELDREIKSSHPSIRKTFST